MPLTPVGRLAGRPAVAGVAAPAARRRVGDSNGTGSTRCQDARPAVFVLCGGHSTLFGLPLCPQTREIAAARRPGCALLLSFFSSSMSIALASCGKKKDTAKRGHGVALLLREKRSRYAVLTIHAIAAALHSCKASIRSERVQHLAATAAGDAKRLELPRHTATTARRRHVA